MILPGNHEGSRLLGHGGLPKVLADVGACQRSECVHNDHLMCRAPEVHVGPGADNADCLTYAHR